jgi:thiol-disulfide isomerase/thioredoxin
MRNVLLVLAALVGLYWAAHRFTPQPVPAISFRDTMGAAHGFGRPCKPALVVFWISGCPFCERALNILDQVRRRYPKESLDIVGIYVNHGTNEAVEAEARAKGHLFDVAASRPDDDNTLINRLDEEGFKFGAPGRAIYVIDATGMYRTVDAGDLNVPNGSTEGEVISALGSVLAPGKTRTGI